MRGLPFFFVLQPTTTVLLEETPKSSTTRAFSAFGQGADKITFGFLSCCIGGPLWLIIIAAS
jgi:hypothetical protein